MQSSSVVPWKPRSVVFLHRVLGYGSSPLSGVLECLFNDIQGLPCKSRLESFYTVHLFNTRKGTCHGVKRFCLSSELAVIHVTEESIDFGG